MIQCVLYCTVYSVQYSDSYRSQESFLLLSLVKLWKSQRMDRSFQSHHTGVDIRVDILEFFIVLLILSFGFWMSVQWIMYTLYTYYWKFDTVNHTMNKVKGTLYRCWVGTLFRLIITRLMWQWPQNLGGKLGGEERMGWGGGHLLDSHSK